MSVATAARRGRLAPLALLIAGGLSLVGCSSTQSGPSRAAIPRRLLEQARPIGRGAAFDPPPSGPPIGRCAQSLGARIPVHVEVFAADRVVILPAGIGARPPRAYSEGRMTHARCYGDLVTLEPTGLLLVRPATHLSISDLFRAWGQPLSPSRIASFTAPAGTHVSAFLDGRLWPGAPGKMPLTPRAEIVLEVGPYVPPHASYTFPRQA